MLVHVFWMSFAPPFEKKDGETIDFLNCSSILNRRLSFSLCNSFRMFEHIIVPVDTGHVSVGW